MSQVINKKLLENEIQNIIQNTEILKIYKLRDICDRVHSTGKMEKYENIEVSEDNLPSDELYEDMNKILELHSKEVLRIGEEKYAGKGSAGYIRKDTGDMVKEGTKFMKNSIINDLWMGSIPKSDDYKEVSNPIIMPKFDGVSCGMRLCRKNIEPYNFEINIANTKGMDVAYSRKNTDITDKIKMITTKLLEKINDSEYIFDNEDRKINLKNVIQINIRGEIVLNNKDKTSKAPAAYVAGKVNGGEKVWEDAIEDIIFIPFEVIKIIYTSSDEIKEYRPTQMDCLNFFKNINENHVIFSKMIDCNKQELKKVFENYEKTILEPIDGVVYCSKEWQYPQCKAETTDSCYGKYAWKPTSESSSILKEVEYSIAGDGKIILELEYNTIVMNGKNYKRVRADITKMKLLDGIGIGSTINIRYWGDIPMIVDYVYDENIEPYKLPKKCPFCNEKLKLENIKEKYTLKCVNVNCRGIIKQKMKNFLSKIGIKGVAEKRLDSLDEISLKKIDNIYIKGEQLKETLKNISTNTFFVALGFGGVTQVDKFLQKTEIGNKCVLKMIQNYEEVQNILNREEYKDNNFIKDISSFISDLK